MLPDGDHAPTSLVSGNPFHLPAWMCHRHLRLPVLTQLPSLFLLLVTLSRSLPWWEGPGAAPAPGCMPGTVSFGHGGCESRPGRLVVGVVTRPQALIPVSHLSPQNSLTALPVSF